MSQKKTKSRKLVPVKAAAPAMSADLLSDVRGLIEQARDATARAVNAALVLLCWQVGTRIRTEVLNDDRVGYGEEIVSTLSRQLVANYLAREQLKE